MDAKILQSMRLMAWERAKGELKSINQANYPSSLDEDSKARSNKFSKALKKFIKKVEYEGLIEGL